MFTAKLQHTSMCFSLTNCSVAKWSGFYGVKLPDGQFLVLYNSVTRRVLTVAISDDDGKPWNDYDMTLENQDEGQFSYSAAVLGCDDQSHATYTYNYQQIKVGHRTHQFYELSSHSTLLVYESEP
jgi:hypothetical protein